MANKRQQLENLGLEPLGEWVLKDSDDNHVIVPRFLSEEQEKRANVEKNVLYAFIVKDEVMYIGKTTQVLSKRLYGYKNPKPNGGQYTNCRNNENIKEELDKKGQVLIFALFDNPQIYQGFSLSLPAGLEDDVIKQIEPSWNISNNRKTAQKTASKRDG